MPKSCADCEVRAPVKCRARAAEGRNMRIVRAHISHAEALPKYNKVQVIRHYRMEAPCEHITCMCMHTIILVNCDRLSKTETLRLP